MNEFGMGQGGAGHLVRLAIAEPDMLRAMSPELLQGVMRPWAAGAPRVRKTS